jgi:hypothetical protein
MSINKEVIAIFPEAVIYKTIINIDNNEIINYLKNLKFNLTENSLNNECNCYISENLNIFKDLDVLKNKIKENVDYYLYEMFKYKMNYGFLNSWSTRTGKNGFSQKHSHHNTFMTGVYYPIGNKSFKINFHKKPDIFWDIQTEISNIFNGDKITLTIDQNNTLILFRSNIEHSIETNESDIMRYSIAFNINPKGYIGSNDNRVLF